MFGRHARHRLAAYCDGELAWPQARMVEAHLRNCAACRALCDEIRTGAQWADGMHRVSPPDELWEAVAREIGKPRRPDRPRGATPGRLPLWSAAAAIAAAALVLVTAVLLMPAPTTPVSAENLLTQAEGVAGTMVQPGQALH